MESIFLHGTKTGKLQIRRTGLHKKEASKFLGVIDVLEDELLFKLEATTGILKENYEVTGVCCRELIERIQLELDMYCPDRKRLYFVDSEESGEKRAFAK